MSNVEHTDGIEAEKVAELVCAGCQSALDVSGLPSFSQLKCPSCGLVQIVPAKFGGFLLIGKLGSGGMGVIYHALDKELGRRVALKVMKRELGDNEEFVRSFKHEARAAAALNHPNVVQIYSFGQVSGQPYIAMELVSDGRLDEEIADGARVEEQRALRILSQVVAGLRAASDVGLVHGDIKPANILFGKNGEAKVVDFGLASFIGQQKQDGVVWGTPYYIAPEKARGKRVDFRSDIYSLGATLFHMLAGKPPFDGATSTDVVMARLNQPPPDLLALQPDLHPNTAAMVARMLEREPTMRHPSYAALQIDVEEALQAAQAPLKRPPARSKAILEALPRAAPRFSRRALARLGIALLGLVLAAGAAAGVYAWRQRALRREASAAERRQIRLAVEDGMAAFDRLQSLAAVIAGFSSNAQSAAARIQGLAAAAPTVIPAAARAGDANDQALEILTDTDDLLALADAARLRLNAAGTAADAQAANRLLAGYFDALIVKHNLIREHTETAAREMKAAQAEARQQADAARAAREAAAREAARKRDEEAARRRAEEEAREAERQRPIRVQAELDRVDETRGAAAPLIAQRKFDQAARALSALLGELTQPESQAYAQAVLDSYRAMEQLKRFVIESVGRAPYPRGWAAGGTPRDIVRAHPARGLTVALGTAGFLDVPWEQVAAVQLAAIAQHYLGRPEVPDDQRTSLAVAMAVFCYESGLFKPAETVAASLLERQPALRDTLDRLMPGFAD